MEDSSTISELETRVDEILFYKWDPLNLSNTNWPRDEYRSYVKEIMRLVQSRVNDTLLAKHLWETAKEKMKVDDYKKSREVAWLINSVALEYFED